MRRFTFLQLLFLAILVIPTLALFVIGDLLDRIEHADVRATLWTLFAIGMCCGVVYASIRLGSDKPPK